MPPSTILIVEDELIVAADLANKLLKLGYTVIGSTDCGEEALELARDRHPDLVLMDIMLAGRMDGVEAADKMRREFDLPVIFLTAHSDRVTLERAKRSEPFGYILKPFEKVTLETQIEMALYKHQVEQKLRASEESYRLLFDRNPDGVFVLDARGRFQVVNPACAAISGYSKEELLGMTFMDLCAPDELEKTVRHFEVTLQQLSRPQLETALIRKDGRRAEVWVVGEPIVNENKEISVHCTAKDITERKQEEGTLQFLMKCGVAAGEDFFQELARYLAQSLAMDFVCIDRLEEGSLSARTEAVYFDGQFADNISYTLHDTPCAKVVGNTICCFPNQVRQLFPNDALLQDMLAESYVGTTLWSSQGQPIGLIAVIGRHPLPDPHLAQSILQLTGVRAASELERRQAEEALRASEERLRQTNSQLEFLVRHRTNELRCTNQALRMLCACNEAVSRMDDEQTLMQEICRTVVEIGGYRMAWVGLADNDAEQNVRPIAHRGVEDGYLQAARISWADNERGQGPTGRAIRTGQMQISGDFRTDPSLAPWREEALRRGFRRSIVLPLRQGKAVVGALNIYSSEPVTFSEAHTKVLNELAEDMAFGLTALQMRTTVRVSRDRLRTLAGSLTLAEQRERRRLALFLHDHFQQLLVGLGCEPRCLGGQGMRQPSRGPKRSRISWPKLLPPQGR